MPPRCGTTSYRSDTKKFAKCGRRSYQYCLTYCRYHSYDGRNCDLIKKTKKMIERETEEIEWERNPKTLSEALDDAFKQLNEENKVK